MIAEFLEVTFSRHGTCKLLYDTSLALARSSPTRRYTGFYDYFYISIIFLMTISTCVLSFDFGCKWSLSVGDATNKHKHEGPLPKKWWTKSGEFSIFGEGVLILGQFLSATADMYDAHFLLLFVPCRAYFKEK